MICFGETMSTFLLLKVIQRVIIFCKKDEIDNDSVTSISFSRMTVYSIKVSNDVSSRVVYNKNLSLTLVQPSQNALKWNETLEREAGDLQ